MDVDKLKITVDQLDKNTGRIVLPSSPEELAALGGRIAQRANPPTSRPVPITQRGDVVAPALFQAAAVSEPEVVVKSSAPSSTVVSEEKLSFQEVAMLMGLLALASIAILLGVQSKMLSDQLKNQRIETQLLKQAIQSNNGADFRDAMLKMSDETVFLREEIEKLNVYFSGTVPATEEVSTQESASKSE